MTQFTATSSELCASLKIDPATLRRQRKLQFFKPGVHFIAVGTGIAKPRLRWNVAEVEKLMSIRSKKTLS